MPSTNLTQTDLNESLRGLIDVDIMMFLPNKNVHFPSNAVTVNNTPLPYTTNLQSIVELTGLPQANIATFENNSWILDGSFLSPSQTYGGGGDSYTGYISNEMTDDNGDYINNPIIRITLSSTIPKVEYLSIQFAGGINTSYPKVFKIRSYKDSELRNEHSYDISQQTGLPLLVAEIGDEDVNNFEFEFVGTVCPHRRSRLNKIMFGKVEQVNPYYLQSWKIDDKASLVADSIPTKTLTYSIINYQGDYNIDNPGNKIPLNYKDALVLFTFSMESNGLWKYAPTKIFNLINISTTSDGIVTFDCGSLLDTLTETFDHDIYNGERTIQDIMNTLLAFSNVATDQYLLNEFVNYKVNIPLPESPVREIIQRLAFSCGATLTVDDDNRIIFSKKNIRALTGISKFMFDRPEPFNSAGVLLEEPSVEALEHTKDIAMYTYDTKISDELSDLGTVNISTQNPTRISFSAMSGSLSYDYEGVTVLEGPYSQHAIITVSYPEDAELPIQIKLTGRKAETTQIIPKEAGINTLLLDSGLAKEVPDNLKYPSSGKLEDTFYYEDWYGAKFKYVCKTRNEYLVKAGDIILFETPFSNGEAIRVGYVLRNSYSSSEDNGEMEVIRLDGNS